MVKGCGCRSCITPNGAKSVTEVMWKSAEVSKQSALFFRGKTERTVPSLKKRCVEMIVVFGGFEVYGYRRKEIME